MKSKTAEDARRDMEERVKKMSPAERLKAFAELCKQMARLAEAGRRRRATPT